MSNPPPLGSLPPLPPVDLDVLIRDIQAQVDGDLARDVALLAKMARAQRAHLVAHRARWRAVQERDANPVARALAVSDKGWWVEPHGSHVYLLWGSSRDVPLFVGGSNNVLARLGTHLSNPERAIRIKRVQLIRCQNRARMNALAMRLIKHYQPTWNLGGERVSDGLG